MNIENTQNIQNEEKEKKKRRGFILLLILTLLFSMTVGGLYSYWVGNVANPANQIKNSRELTIGSGKDVNTQIDISGELEANSKKLVPVGKAVVSSGNDNVEEYTTTYEVYWKETVVGTKALKPQDLVNGTLKITSEALINDQADSDNLVNVEINPNNENIIAEA